MQIGGATFEGPVNIIREDHVIMIPIQMLHHPSDSSSIVRIDLEGLQLRVCSRERLQQLTKKSSVWDMTYNQFGMPVITTSLSIKAYGQRIDITGKFIADLGNASLLFLNRYNPDIDKLAREGKLRLYDARDKRTGEVVAQGFKADNLTVCNRTYKGFTVGVSTFKGLEECGFFGVKFFQTPAVFDFDENKLYL